MGPEFVNHVTPIWPSHGKPKLQAPTTYSDPKTSVHITVWVFKMRVYLEHFQLPPSDQLNLVSSYLSGDAMQWFMHTQTHMAPFLDAEDLLVKLSHWAAPPSSHVRTRQEFFDLRQSKTVADYVQRFETLRLRVANISEADAVQRFVHGLKPSVQAVLYREEARTATFLSLKSAMDLALIEDPFGSRQDGHRPEPKFTPAREPDAMDVDAVDANGHLYKLTDSQRAYLRAKGGCFQCRKLGHMADACPQKTSLPPKRRHETIAVEGDDSDGSAYHSAAPDHESDSDWDRLNVANIDTQTPEPVEAPFIPVSINSDTSPLPRLKDFDRDDWMLNTNVSNMLFEHWGTPTLDLFANTRNKQAPFYFRKTSDLDMGDGCLGNDAFSASWDYKELVYANPPWSLAEKVIAKVKKDKLAKMILILPFTNATLRAMSIAPPMRLTHTPDLFLPPSRQGTHTGGVGSPHWKESWAFLVSGTPKPDELPVIPRAGTSCSRFVFNCTINETRAVALADTGCTAMVVSADYVEKHKLKTERCEETSFRFANKTSRSANRKITIEFTRDKYTRTMDCYVAAIKHDIILGTPWFDSVATNLDWRSRQIHFLDYATNTRHTWSAIGKPKSQMIRRVRYSDPQAFLRNTEWAAVIDLQLLHDPTEQDIAEMDVDESLEIPKGMYDYSQADQADRPAPIRLISDERLARILKKYDSIFQEPTELPPSRPDDHGIELTDVKIPPWRNLGNLNQYELEALKEYLQKMFAKHWIEHSKSPFGASILFAKKKDGTLRVVVDYRGLNNITVKDRTPLPNIKEMQERLRGAKIFTKLDLRDGFNNILVRPEDQHKTAFRTRYGHFQYRVLPFGLCNAPATFMRMMNRIFGDLYDSCIIAYVDDIRIYSATPEEHEAHLALVFDRLREHRLYLKLSKCSFAVDRTEFCGTDVDTTGIYLDRSKLDPLFRTRIPKTVKDVQSFLGVCNWFRDFIPQFADSALPLTELTKKNCPWRWTPLEHAAVVLLLHRISSAPCLRYFDPSLDIVLHTDASLFGIGGWLGQVHPDGLHPVLFWSRKLIPAEANYPTHERELLALVKMCEKFRPMLLGRPFLAKTDHRAIIHLQNQPLLSHRQVRWVQCLQEYQIVIEYIPGEKNFLADLLSRSPTFVPLCSACKTKHIDVDSADVEPLPCIPDLLRQHFVRHPSSIPFREGGGRAASSARTGLHAKGYITTTRIGCLSHDQRTSGPRSFMTTMIYQSLVTRDSREPWKRSRGTSSGPPCAKMS